MAPVEFQQYRIELQYTTTKSETHSVGSRANRFIIRSHNSHVSIAYRNTQINDKNIIIDVDVFSSLKAGLC